MTHELTRAFFPEAKDIPFYTDKYFTRTRKIIEKYGDKEVVYAVFMRRPVVCAPAIAVDWLKSVMAQEGHAVDVRLNYQEGEWVGSGEPIMYVRGSFKDLVEKETLLLQKLGAACVAAYNASAMCYELPNVTFMAMDARHCAGTEMADLMAYAAFVGSISAQKQGAKGFYGTANDSTAGLFGLDAGLGTMPHALIGYAGATLKAAEMFNDLFPEETLTVLVDYYGREISDGLEVCRKFKDLADAGKVALRLDTHGGRYIEGLDRAKSYAVLEDFAPDCIRCYRQESELPHLIGTGVSAAGIWHMRKELDKAGFPKVKIVASSGFSTEKCRLFKLAHAPVDFVGTGSFLPEKWSETYATADIVSYDGVKSVKVGREFLLDKLK